MPVVLTGGSAAAIYAPQAYASYDADFILDNDDALADVAPVLQPLSFARYGKSRIFVHSKSHFTLDFPKGPLAVGGDYIRETSVLERETMRLRILTRTDCIRDRLAHFYHWNDYTALNAAVAVALHGNETIEVAALRSWTKRESTAFSAKFAEFERRCAALQKR